MTSSHDAAQPDGTSAEQAGGPGTVRVRAAYPRDLGVLVRFNEGLAQETEGKALDRGILTAGIRAVFDDPSRGGYFIAERGGEVVGSLMITHEWSDWRNGVFWWIQSVYVEQSARRTGVFRCLYEGVLARARASREVCGVRLYVERENTGAQAVYDAIGMSRSHYRMYELDFVLGDQSTEIAP